MRVWPICLVLGLVIAGSARAEDAPPDAGALSDTPPIGAPPPAGAPMAPAGAPMAPGGAPMAPGRTLTPQQQANRDRIQAEREACRNQMRDQGLRGEAMRAGVQDCLSKVDPVAGARMKCMQAGMAKGFKGPDLWASVRQCMRPS